jgi:hypothetical protein
MAVNVFLVFFFGANPSSFRKHVWLYCLVCFGAPAIPAIACLLIRDERGKVYGDATVSWGLCSWNGFGSVLTKSNPTAVVLDRF